MADFQNGKIKSSAPGEPESPPDDATEEGTTEPKPEASAEAMPKASVEPRRFLTPVALGTRGWARNAFVAAKRAQLETASSPAGGVTQTGVASAADDVPGTGRVGAGGGRTPGGTGDVNGTMIGCSDVRPTRPDGRPNLYSCEQQAKWGKCETVRK